MWYTPDNFQAGLKGRGLGQLRKQLINKQFACSAKRITMIWADILSISLSFKNKFTDHMLYANHCF